MWRPTLKDPKDDLVLELAVVSGSDAIITHNIGDFSRIARFRIRVIRPGEFLPGEFLKELGVDT